MRLESPKFFDGKGGFIYRPRARPNLVVGTKVVRKKSGDEKKVEVREPHKLSREDWISAAPEHFRWVPDHPQNVPA